MAKQKVKTTKVRKTYRKSSTKGKHKRCRSCGRFL